MAPPQLPTPPEWLDQDFVESALRKGGSDKLLKIKSYFIEPATGVGDNFVSQMFRVKITRKNGENLSFLIKSLPLGAMQEFVHDTDIFIREARMFSNTLPRIHKYLARAGYDHKLFADVLYEQGPPNNLIFLEDLKGSGYVNANRQKGLDMDHCIVLLESLATFHAGSLAMLQHEPEMVKDFDEGFWVEKHEDMIQKSVKNGVVALAKDVVNWENFPSKYIQILKDLEHTILRKLFNTTSRNDDRLNVILHADTWTNNFMYKYVDGKIDSLKFVDFQLSCYNAPVLDLLYFIFTSPVEEIRLKSVDRFLEIYHKKLVAVSNDLNIENFNYSLNDLKNDFKRKLFFGFVVSITVFPFTIASPSDVIDVNDLLDDNTEYDTTPFRTQRFREGFKLMLPYFEENGIF